MRAFRGIALLVLLLGSPEAWAVGMVDTGQVRCYNNYGEMRCPKPGEPFYGQDANYSGLKPSYRDNGDGTVSDLVTGLMWSKAVDRDKVSLAQAKRMAKQMRLRGHKDWRVPTIKEMYSLIDFKGYTGFQRSRGRSMTAVLSNAVPYINKEYFDFRYGDTRAGERYIDAQWLTSTVYVSTTMHGDKTLFGVNFADGRIKGYGYKHARGRRPEKLFYVRFVRGPKYGENRYKDNGDGTVTDQSSGLMWAKSDSKWGMNWKEALEYAENLELAGHTDWRLPNAKELQYIVDYSRSPDTSGSAALDPLFRITSITNEAGKRDFPFFWTSTTHLDGSQPGANAAYVSFGRAMGSMFGQALDVHGAGAQRSDPKVGKPGLGHGPQGDARRVTNYVRVVRRGAELATNNPMPNLSKKSPRMGRGGGGFTNRLDRDGDGKVSRQEFDGPPNAFGFFDKNSDGYISGEEAPTGPPRRGR